MKRSSWKYTPVTFYDYYFYISNLLKIKTPYKSRIAPRTKIITTLAEPWNSIHQGKNYTIINNYYLKLGFKYGSFTKTRKPFFFRSKKKNNKCKVITIIIIVLYIIQIYKNA